VLDESIPNDRYDRKYAGVIIVLPDTRIVLQQRDDKPEILHPGGITTFGGQVEINESFEDAAIREMAEELKLSLDRLRLRSLGYTRKVELDGSVTLCNIFVVDLNILENVVQQEGKELYIATKAEIEANPKVTDVCKTAVRSVP
jgi:8-oxo-dGTP pyrophosphatase MutT (NUDIX family)